MHLVDGGEMQSPLKEPLLEEAVNTLIPLIKPVFSPWESDFSFCHSFGINLSSILRGLLICNSRSLSSNSPGAS